MLELTKKTDYALRLMVEIAASTDSSLTTSEVAHREQIPYQFLRKIVHDLVAAGLLTSSRGGHGGLSLAHPAQTVSLLEIVRAVDEPAVSRCVIDPAACTRRYRCVIYPVWRRLQREMERAMEGVLLSDLAGQHRTVFRAAANDGASLATVQMAPKRDSKGLISRAWNKVTVEVATEGRNS